MSKHLTSESSVELLVELSTRIEQLESQLAFQDDTIDTLNQLVAKQNLALGNLEQKLHLLGRKFQEQQTADAGSASATAHEPPPHY